MSFTQEAPHPNIWEPPQTDLSLRKLIIENSWLLAHPLAWTTHHLKILGCEFHDIDVPLEAETETETTPPDEDTARYAEMIANHATPGFRYFAAPDLLCCQGSPLELVTGHPTFFFARTRVHVPECQIYYPTTTATQPAANDNASPLTVGYFHYDVVIKERERFFRDGMHSIAAVNPPVHRILQKKLAKSKPEVWTQDQYLLCVMLSLAQHRRNDFKQSRSVNFDVRLLVSNKADKIYAHVFHARFSNSVLCELDRPSDHEKETWPTIYHSRVPYQPYDTFATRITTHLSRDIHAEPKIMFKNETPNMWTQTLVMMESK
ncbi:hypothetical protein NXS19_012960 [Fusarium pseudograminearum]|nr:hypothetical protein NXS19_012960 [Fusarium pseudograminearum]